MATLTTTQAASASALKRFIIRHPVAAFLGMVYGITWLLFLPSMLSENGLGVLPVAIPVGPFLLLGNLVGATLSAYIVTRVTGGREGVRDLRRHTWPHDMSGPWEGIPRHCLEAHRWMRADAIPILNSSGGWKNAGRR